MSEVFAETALFCPCTNWPNTWMEMRLVLGATPEMSGAPVSCPGSPAMTPAIWVPCLQPPAASTYKQAPAEFGTAGLLVVIGVPLGHGELKVNGTPLIVPLPGLVKQASAMTFLVVPLMRNGWSDWMPESITATTVLSPFQLAILLAADPSRNRAESEATVTTSSASTARTSGEERSTSTAADETRRMTIGRTPVSRVSS